MVDAIPPRESEGFVWANQVLRNSGDTSLHLTEIRPVTSRGEVHLLSEPILWAPNRAPTTGAGSLVGWQLPLPPEWQRLPDVAIEEAVIEPSTDNDGWEVVLEIAPVDEVTVMDGIEVSYVVDGEKFREFFSSGLTLCPVDEPTDCLS